jgi:hypothetical protein
MGFGSSAGAAVSAKNTMETLESQEAQFRDWMEFLRDPSVAVNQLNAIRELFTGPQMAQDILEAIGTGDIIDYLTRPIPLTRGEKREKALFEEAEPLMREIQGFLTEPIRSQVLDLIRTGKPTDLAPIIAGETYRLKTDTGPALAERYAGGLAGSGFLNAIAQAGEDLGMYLGEKAYDAREAATARIMEILPMAGRLLSLPLDLQTGFAEALGASGERWRLRKESTRPGFRQLQAFPGLVAAEGQQGYMLPSYPQQSYGSAGSTANWAALAPSIANSLGSLAPLLKSGGSSLVNWLGRLGDGGGSSPYSYSQFDPTSSNYGQLFGGTSVGDIGLYNYGSDAGSFLGGSGWGATGSYDIEPSGWSSNF